MEDANGDHGFLAKVVTRKNKTIECFFSREETATEKDTTKILLKKGLNIPHLKPANCYALNFYLNNFKPEFEAIGVDMVGWQGGNKVYMLPFVNESRNCYNTNLAGEKPIEYILQQKTATPRILKKKGTLDEWKRTVGEVCRGNELHTFAILASLTAPALKLLNEEGGFFHYVGSTSIGKSTILHVAKSVWGFKDLGSFRATDNNLESICKNSNDGAMFLDEMGEVNADDLFKIIYMLANGVTKGRADRNGDAKETANFTVLAQSTGEIGLEAKLAEKKLQVKGGQLIRMAEIDADRGKGLNTFDVLNINPDTKEPFTSGREQAELLKTHADQNHGIVIDNFMQKVVADIEGYKESLKEVKAKWLARKLRGDEGVEVARMAKRFSTIFATGVIALEFGIIPHSFSEIESCIDAIFTNWLDRFGGDSSHEFRMIIADLRKLCVEQQYSRFSNSHPNSEERENLPHNKAGYWKTEDGTLHEYWIDTAVFDREVLKGHDKKVFLPLLVDKGYVKKEDGIKCQRRPSKEKSQRFIVIPASVFSSENE
jgi:putative DNA primase/helicase